MRLKYFRVLAAGMLAACATTPPGAAVRTVGSNVLTREEILASNVTNAYDAIVRLRPQFLRSHGSTTLRSSDAGYPSIYLNRRRFGEISDLKQIEAAMIREIRYYTAAESLNRFSDGAPSGAIEVITESQ